MTARCAGRPAARRGRRAGQLGGVAGGNLVRRGAGTGGARSERGGWLLPTRGMGDAAANPESAEGRRGTEAVMEPGATAAMTTGAALALVEREREAWEALLAEVGEARMLEPGPMGEWSFRDLAAHLTAWRSRTLARLEAAADGQPEPPPPWPDGMTGDDEINAWFRERDRDKPLADVLAESRASSARLAAAVRRLPADELNDPDRFPWLEGRSLAGALADGSLFSHWHEDHEPAVRAWLAGRSAGG